MFSPVGFYQGGQKASHLIGPVVNIMTFTVLYQLVNSCQYQSVVRSYVDLFQSKFWGLGKVFFFYSQHINKTFYYVNGKNVLPGFYWLILVNTSQWLGMINIDLSHPTCINA